jgi:hypothetical protein
MKNAYESIREREKEWCKRTFLRPATKQLHYLFKVKSYNDLPDGLDHTSVYHGLNGHVVLTEPYGGTERILAGLDAFTRKHGVHVTYALGKFGTGVWYPNGVYPVLISVGAPRFDLQALADALPGKPT